MGTMMTFYAVKNKIKDKAELKEKLKKVEEITQDKAYGVFNSEKEWFAVFSEPICEGYVAVKNEIEKLSQIFEAPAVSFAIMDSDMVFVNFSDSSREFTSLNGKTHFGFEEYGIEINTDYPEALNEFLKAEDIDRAKEAWAKEDFVFADEIMEEICEVLEIPTVYSLEDIPSGFEVVEA